MQTSTPIRVAIIGAGLWGPNLIRLFDDNPRSEVVAVADRDESRLARLGARFPDVRLSVDAAEAIGADDVDAVVVATPPTTHEALVRAALEQGRHVLVEKPLTSDAASAEQLVGLAERSGLVLMVGHVFLYNPAVQRAKEYVQDGTLGRIYYIAMERTNLGPIRADVNAAWDLAAHDISIASYWLESQPLSVSATGGSWINPGVADAVFATVRYPGNVLVSLHASWLHPRKSRQIALIGEERMLTLDDLSLTEPLRLYDKNVSDEVSSAATADSFAKFRASVREGEIVIPKVNMTEPLGAECAHFVECVAEGLEPRTGGRDGLAVVHVLEAISRSIDADGLEQPVEALAPVSDRA